MARDEMALFRVGADLDKLKRCLEVKIGGLGGCLIMGNKRVRHAEDDSQLLI